MKKGYPGQFIKHMVATTEPVLGGL